MVCACVRVLKLRIILSRQGRDASVYIYNRIGSEDRQKLIIRPKCFPNYFLTKKL